MRLHQTESDCHVDRHNQLTFDSTSCISCLRDIRLLHSCPIPCGTDATCLHHMHRNDVCSACIEDIRDLGVCGADMSHLYQKGMDMNVEVNKICITYTCSTFTTHIYSTFTESCMKVECIEAVACSIDTSVCS